MVDQTITQPVEIDAKGNLCVNGLEGISLQIAFQDALGAPRNMSALTLQFVTPKFIVTLTPGTSNDTLQLIATQAQIASLGVSSDGRTGPAFVVRDVTNPTVPDVLWEGMVIVRGLTKVPSA